MTDNIPARAATSPELVKFRSEGDFTKLGLAIQHPVTVYTARVNQTFTSLDGVFELTYDAGSGTLVNVLKNMLVFIGSAAGLYDVGICRIRQLPTSTVFYISQTSHIQFADNLYITVVDSMPILQRDITYAGGDILMDYDIQFGDLLNGGVIARIGPLTSVLKLVAGTVTFAPPDPSLSACYDGAAIVSYLYDAPGAASTADMDTIAPSWTYDTAGEYRWSCTITDSLGRETTAYRWAFVDPDPIEFILEDCSGDFDSGDWSFEVTCLSGVARSEVYDRALVTLFGEREFYNYVEGSIGKIAGYENIKCAGWIDGESITDDREGGEVSFTVRGPVYWLSQLRAFPFDLQDTSSAPTTWKLIEEMTVDKALAHILYWTSTAPTVMDCFFTGSEVRTKILVEPGGSLSEQVNAIALKVFAKSVANNYGQIFIEIDPQLISSADRGDLPVVMDITRKDWGGPLELERKSTPRTAMVELGAISDYDGSTSIPVHARAPGNIGETYGDSNSYENYILLDQAECNRIAGCLLAVENNEYEPLEIPFKTNNPLIDIAPRQYCTISLAAEDNVRGVLLSGVRLIPRKVSLEYDSENFTLSTQVTFELEAIGADGIEYHPPTVMDNNIDFAMEDFGGLDFPGFDGFFPPTVPPDVTTPCSMYVHNSFSLTWSPAIITGNNENRIAKAYLPCKLRASGSWINLPGIWYNDSRTHYAVYAMFEGARVLTATVTHAVNGNTATFTPVSDTEVDGFEMEVEEFNTDTIWDYAEGIDNGGGVPTFAYDIPSAKQLHYTHETGTHPYGSVVNAYLINTFGTLANITVGLKFRFRAYSPPPPPPPFSIPSFQQYDGGIVFYVEGPLQTILTGTGIKTYWGASGGRVDIIGGWNPNVYAEQDYEAWATIIDAIGERLIKLGTSTLFDVCAI